MMASSSGPRKSSRSGPGNGPKPSRSPRARRPSSRADALNAAPRARPAATELTAYESQQVRQIAAWKAQAPQPADPDRPGPIPHPLARVVEQDVSETVLQQAIAAAFEASELAAGQQDIRRRSGVRNLGKLRQRPLEECDRLAHAVAVWSQGQAATVGATPEAGGFLASALEIPALLGLSARTTVRLGHSYGETFDGPEDQRLVRAILLAAITDDPEQADRSQTEGAGAIQLRLDDFSAIPGLGPIAGGLQNYAFLRRVETAARRVFQERWLLANGKVPAIEPGPGHERAVERPPRLSVWSRAVYSGFYYLGYGTMLPVWYAARLLAPGDHALGRGLRDGAVAATADAARALDRLRGGPAAPGQPAGSPVAVPA